MCILRWEVEHAVHVVLVIAEVRRVTIENFSNRIYSSSFLKARIERFLDRLGRVNSKTINWKMLAMTYVFGILDVLV